MCIRDSRYQRLQNRLQTTRSLLTEARKRREQLEAGIFSTPRIVEVRQWAVEPGVPISPRPMLWTAVAGLLGLLFGVGLALLIHHLDDTVRDDDTLRGAGLEPVGAVPYIREKGRRERVVETHPQSRAAESVRAARMALLFLLRTKNPHTILVTSANPREGKTLNSSNLALAMAQLGRRTLLVDADLRRPSIHKIFEVEAEPGLSNLLAGEAEPDAVIRSGPVEGLSIVSCGARLPNPADMLASPRMENATAAFKERFDTVILDSPPVLGLADATILARLSDAVLLVALAGHTRQAGLRRAVAHLSGAKPPLIAGLLNEVTKRTASYYYDYYYHYHYRYGGGKETPSRKSDKTKKDE